MNDENTYSELGSTPEDELVALKKRADLLGISYRVNITLETLKEKVQEAIGQSKQDEGLNDKPEITKEDPTANLPANVKPIIMTRQKQWDARRKEQMRLVRVQITCMNPTKHSWQGEILTAAGRGFGSIKKFILFNTPYHVPVAILNYMQERECQIFESKRNAKTGDTTKHARLIKEFSIQELPSLTRKELEQIATRQSAQADMSV